MNAEWCFLAFFDCIKQNKNQTLSYLILYLSLVLVTIIRFLALTNSIKPREHLKLLDVEILKTSFLSQLESLLNVNLDHPNISWVIWRNKGIIGIPIKILLLLEQLEI